MSKNYYPNGLQSCSSKAVMEELYQHANDADITILDKRVSLEKNA